MSVSNRMVRMSDSEDGASDTASMMESRERMQESKEAAYDSPEPRFDAGLMPRTEDDVAQIAYLEGAKTGDDSWRYRPKIEKSGLLDILKHQQQLERNLALLAGLTNVNGEDNEIKNEALLACKRSLEMFRRFVVSGLGSDPLMMLPTQSSGRVAEKLFAVPELTEMVLMELSPARLLCTASVSKAFEAAVVSSTKLQDKLGLRALEHSIWKSPFNWRGTNGSYGMNVAELGEIGESLAPLRQSLKCRTMDTEKARSRAVKDHVATIQAVFQSHETPDYADGGRGYHPDDRPLPSIGDRGRAIMICQPPVKEMFVLASCCRTRFGTRFEPLAPTIRNFKGLSVGDLLDATIKASKQHEMCPYAAKRHHRPDGTVDCRISFEGTVQLQANDPRIPSKMRPEGAGTRGDGRDYSDCDEPTPYSEDESVDTDAVHDARIRSYFWTPKRDVLDDYVDYKREACANGEEIPTLAEFQAWQAEGSQRADEEDHEDRDRPQEVY
ncbi:hypothetical protein LTR56_001446 [Elasticomyces elasticus]|nr:hypothetical protein LTR56_001446 [Elasticomyces elasticus]KAK3668631.1 hypothetical protein LTR22_000518 [Elasticomyces elasticus]KAK4931983.1 hypothetical protein LTR49_001670 [Elasticomyces elasticus]KAK5768485.1 hypothetical protein LTS12_001273 [Elasticomyces elasticus]